MIKKLDKEHLDEINSLRESFAQNSNTLGTIETELLLMQDRIKELEEEKQKQYTQFLQLRKQESDLVQTMRERYGEGQINIVDGTFTAADGLVQ